MRLNVEFLLVAYFVGLFVDWVFQWQWQAMNKSKWESDDDKLLSFAAVITHAITYAGLTTAITLFLVNVSVSKWLVFGVLFITHALIDTRIPVKWIMRFKGLTDEQLHDYQNYGFMHIGIDHRLHELVILILAFFV